MDYKKGSFRLKIVIQENNPDKLADFATLEGRLLKNEEDERKFGASENTRNERNQIIYALNALSLQECGLSFTDLCLKDDSVIADAIQSVSQKGRVDDESETRTKYFGQGNRWAVLVGVNVYEDEINYGNLKVCVKDVQALADQLKQGDFNENRIQVLSDNTNPLPTKNNILSALKAVASATAEDDLLLFYYSGHGDIAGKTPYLVARDGQFVVLEDTAVSIERVKQIMESANARAKVLILDACHSGANIMGKGPKKMSQEFIERVFEQAEGFAILASCKQNELSYEWRENDQSVFTHYLLDALLGNADRDDKNFVTIQDANRHVSDGVRLWASNKKVSQTPTFEYHGAGDIILITL